MTLTDALAEAVMAELDRRRLWLDSLDGLRSVMIVVKFTPTGTPRTVILSQETETVLNGPLEARQRAGTGPKSGAEAGGRPLPRPGPRTFNLRPPRRFGV